MKKSETELDPWSLYIYAMKAPMTREKYTVLSLVKEGIVRIADLVQQSGVLQVYLLKAGYKIAAGTVSS